MSELSEELIERGPFKPGDLIPYVWRAVTCEQMNELRQELIARREAAYDVRKLNGALSMAQKSRELWRKRAIEAGWTEPGA